MMGVVSRPHTKMSKIIGREELHLKSVYDAYIRTYYVAACLLPGHCCGIYWISTTKIAFSAVGVNYISRLEQQALHVVPARAWRYSCDISSAASYWWPTVKERICLYKNPLSDGMHQTYTEASSIYMRLPRPRKRGFGFTDLFFFLCLYNSWYAVYFLSVHGSKKSIPHMLETGLIMSLWYTI